MAVEIATAYVSIIPSARGFGRNLSRELDGEMSSAATQAGALAGSRAAAAFGVKLAAGVAVAATAAAGGLVLLGKKAASAGLQTAASNEQAAISFETMLGSAEKAAEHINELKRFAAITPFEFPELQQAAKALLTTGVDAKKIVPIMRTLGDVTSGMGTGAEGIQRATVALQQMSAAGRISAEDLWQLRDAGIPVFQLLQGATGKTQEELAALVENGKLGRKELDALMKALETGKGLEKFSGLMEKQSKSLTGMISTLKDVVGQGLAEAMAPAVTSIKAQIPVLTDTLMAGLQEVGPILTDVVTGLVDLVAGLAPLVMPLLKDFGGLLRDVFVGVGKIIKDLAPLLSFLARVLIDRVGGALVELMPEFRTLLVALAPIAVIFTRLAIIVTNLLAPVFASLLRAITPIVDILAKGLDQAFAALQRMDLAGIFARLLPVFEQVMTALMPLVDVFLLFANDVGATLAAMVPDLAGAFVELALAFLPLLPDVTRLVADLLPVLVTLFRDLAPDIIRIVAVAIPLLEEMTRLRAIWGDLLLRVIIPFLPIIDRLLEALLPVLEKVIVPMVEALTKWVARLSESKAGVMLLVGALGLLGILKLAGHFVIATIQGFNLISVLTVVNALLSAQAAIQKRVAGAAAEASANAVAAGASQAEAAAAGAEASAAVGAWEKMRTGIQAAKNESLLFKGVAMAVTVVTSPWFYIPVAILAIGAAFFAAYESIQPFHDAVDALWASFQVGLDWLKEVFGLLLGGDFDKAGEMFSNMGNSIVTGLINIGNAIKEKVPEWALAILEGLKNVGLAVVGWVTGTLLPAIGNALLGLGRILFWYVFKAAPFVIFGLIRMVIMMYVWIYTTFIPWLIRTGIDLLKAFVGWIKEAAPAAFEALKAFLASIGPWFTDTALPWISDQAAALSAALVNWVSETISPLLTQLGEWLSNIGSWITGTAIPAVVKAASLIGGAVVSAVIAAFNWLKDNWSTVLKILLALIFPIPALIGLAFVKLGPILLHFLQEAPYYLAEGLKAFGDNIGGWIATAASWIAEKAGALGSALWGWLVEAVPMALGKLGEWLGVIGSWIVGTALPWLGNKAVELGGALIGWIADVGPKALAALGGFLQSIGVWLLEDAVPWLISKGISLYLAMLAWILQLAINAPFYLANFLKAIGDWILGAIAWLVPRAWELLTAFIGWMTHLPLEAATQLQRFLSWFGQWIIDAGLWLVEKAWTLFIAFVSWLDTAIKAAPGLLLGFLGAIWNWIKGAVPWLWEQVIKLKDAIVSFIVNAADATPGLLADWGNAILDWIKGLPGQIADAAKNMFVGITNAFLAAVNWIIRTWNDIEIEVPEIEIMGKKVGGFTWETKNIDELPKIKSFATGGRPPLNRPSLVGELGPELFWPDQAGTIVPHAALAPAASGLNIGHLEVTGQDQPAETAWAIRSELRWLSMQAGVT